MSCNFIFCIHNHQPVGNFDHIFKWAFDDCYNKMLGIFMEYPDFRFSIHHSGPLLEWIESNSPGYLNSLKVMAESGQAEIIGGGFYEPIFSVINEKDIKSQIFLMQNFCKNNFGLYPKGFWTAERVWDPEIPNLVSGFDLEYTILDDIHFRYAGIDEKNLYGYFVTERLDKKLIVFPIDKFLRYSIPFKLPEDTINYFKQTCDLLGSGAFVYGDDGEKFGLWPHTYKWVFEERWLRNFIESVLKEDWIKLVHPSEYIVSHKPRGRVYLTQGSYFELSEWALPPDTALKLININNEIKSWHRENDFYPFIKGGVWNNFLIKYPESNAINKRTILLSNEIAEFEVSTGIKCTEEKTELYRSECNCAYWHGLFGGIYLNHLRHALYEHLLKSEGLFLKRKNENSITVNQEDFWNEGSEQILIRKTDQSVIIVPGFGGTVSEFGIYDKAFNIFNTLRRKPETYHETLKNLNDDYYNNDEQVASIHDRITVKEKNLKNYLIFDQSRRYSFKDIFFKRIPAPEDLMFSRNELYDCGSLDYDYQMEKKDDEISISLSRTLNVWNNELTISKTFKIAGNATGIKAEYNITGADNIFGVEFNINLLSPHDENRYFEIPGMDKNNSFLDIPGFHDNITYFALTDEYEKFKIKFSCSPEAKLLHYPVYTVSQSDSGFEKNYQGSCLILLFDLTKKNESLAVELMIDTL
ncbi:MAG: DUF1926 domain-containing protein [Spirochaetes bacterium]|nr:DUF1926 domain-containing protein [Spirochaetota bacterium]